MIRIDMSELVVRENKYYSGSILFNGVGYAKGDEHEIQTYIIENGKVVGTYTPICAEGVSGYAQIDVTGLLAEEVNTQYPLEFDGGHFTGIGYEFTNGLCNHEMLFIDGAVRSEMWWRPTGMLIACNRSGEFSEQYHWLANGQMDSAAVNTAALRILFKFHDTGELRSLLIEGDVRSRMPELARLEHFPVKSMDGFAFLRGGPSVFLARDGIDDLLFEMMARSGVFGKTQSLLLKDTRVTGKSLSALAQLISLRTIVLESNNEQQRELASELRRHRPDLVVDHIPERIL